LTGEPCSIPRKRSEREELLALRELDAQIAKKEKFQREFEIKS